uniref:Uncharacterized protein n=1 Tax=Anopheles merus TaxID=30066 RepID=A0A1Y9IPQ7_ANOME
MICDICCDDRISFSNKDKDVAFPHSMFIVHMYISASNCCDVTVRLCEFHPTKRSVYTRCTRSKCIYGKQLAQICFFPVHFAAPHYQKRVA